MAAYHNFKHLVFTREQIARLTGNSRLALTEGSRHPYIQPVGRIKKNAAFDWRGLMLCMIYAKYKNSGIKSHKITSVFKHLWEKGLLVDLLGEGQVYLELSTQTVIKDIEIFQRNCGGFIDILDVTKLKKDTERRFRMLYPDWDNTITDCCKQELYAGASRPR